MKKVLFLAAVLAAGLASALTPEEKAAQERERAEIKASEEAWKALRKEAEDLAQQDFKGGFADYWHDRIDAARELLDASLTNAVFRNRCKRGLREAARTTGMPLEKHDIILFATRDTHDAKPDEVGAALQKLLKKAGVR